MPCQNLKPLLSFQRLQVLLSPIVLWKHREKLHCIGGLMTSVVMTGAIFFHIFTPLGWHPTWQVANEAACQAVFIPRNTMDAHRAISQLIVILIALFIFPLFLYFVYYFSKL
jgi:hypothetical protein